MARSRPNDRSLELLAEGGHIPRELYTESVEAYEFIMHLRLLHQLGQMEENRQPDNYINPADLNHPVAFNVLENVSEEHRHLVASGLLGIFKKLWAESWGPRLEYVLNNAIMALLEYPGSTLLGVMRLLIDKSFRKKVINKITDRSLLKIVIICR